MRKFLHDIIPVFSHRLKVSWLQTITISLALWSNFCFSGIFPPDPDSANPADCAKLFNFQVDNESNRDWTFEVKLVNGCSRTVYFSWTDTTQSSHQMQLDRFTIDSSPFAPAIVYKVRYVSQ